MSPTLEAYREAKANYNKLRAQAKKELIARFHELAGELLAVQKELLDDFGEKIALPAKGAKKAAKPKTSSQSAAAPAAAPAPPPPPSPKVTALQKQLEKQKQKLAGLQASGKPSKAVEDRIYEIEDEIRLAAGGAS
jgi:hypothetical protein